MKARTVCAIACLASLAAGAALAYGDKPGWGWFLLVAVLLIPSGD